MLRRIFAFFVDFVVIKCRSDLEWVFFCTDMLLTILFTIGIEGCVTTWYTTWAAGIVDPLPYFCLFVELVVTLQSNNCFFLNNCISEGLMQVAAWYRGRKITSGRETTTFALTVTANTAV